MIRLARRCVPALLFLLFSLTAEAVITYENGGGGYADDTLAAIIQDAGVDAQYVVTDWPSQTTTVIDDTIAFLAKAGIDPARIKGAPGITKAKLKPDLVGGCARSVHVPNPYRFFTPSVRSELIGRLKKARVLFISGGDQARFMTVMIEDPALEALIRRRTATGELIIVGTSAGAMVQSPVMIIPKRIDGKLSETVPKLVQGLGVLPEPIAVDTHFAQRNRFVRAYAAVRERPELMVMGLDERTSVRRDGDIVEVHGAGKVHFIYEEKVAGEKFPRRKSKIVTVSAGKGQKFDLVRRERVP